MQHNLREFLRHGGSGQYVFARQKGAVCGYRAGVSIKSFFPGYAELRADFTDQLDRVIADNTRVLLNALTPPDTVPWVTEAGLRDVSDAKEEALRQWDARLAAIFEEYETHTTLLQKAGCGCRMARLPKAGSRFSQNSARANVGWVSFQVLRQNTSTSGWKLTRPRFLACGATRVRPLSKILPATSFLRRSRMRWVRTS